MKLIVALGNPGKEYENTRHNTGFIFLDAFVKENFPGQNYKKFNNSLLLDGNIGGNKFIVCKPQCFMNFSGIEFKKILSFYKIDIDDCMVVYDDLAIPIGKYKLSAMCGHGGHNGIKNIIELLGTKKFFRLRIGVLGETKGETPIKDYVLGNFLLSEKIELVNIEKKIFAIFHDFIECKGSVAIMNEHQI